MKSCIDCKNKDGSMIDALASIIWYDGHYEWLLPLADRLDALPNGAIHFVMDDVEWHTEKHTILMLLVGMFGDWGTSIRCGWIAQTKECAAFIRALCEECEGA